MGAQSASALAMGDTWRRVLRGMRVVYWGVLEYKLEMLREPVFMSQGATW